MLAQLVRYDWRMDEAAMVFGARPLRCFWEITLPNIWPAMLGALGVPLSTNKVSASSFGLHWTARNDSITVGANRVRAYRLQAKILERWRIAFFISPVGELLRAEFPGDLVLLNTALAGIRQTTEP